METVIEKLQIAWPAIMTAPWVFAALAVALGGVIWAVVNGIYAREDKMSQRHISMLQDEVSGLKGRVEELTDTKKELMERVGDQAEHGRIAALSVKKLRERAEEFVAEARTWIEGALQADRAYRMPNALIPREQWTPEQHAAHAAHLSGYGNYMDEWTRRFKVQSIVLRDEMKKHLPNEAHPDLSRMHTYDHPTNFFGVTEVVDDIQRMAMLLN